MSKRDAAQSKRTKRARASRLSDSYAAFDALDGSHPWQEAVPEGSVLYPTRCLRKGRILYFNYMLAKEMGLISLDHPEKLTPALERRLIDTFSIQIVNEYDQSIGVRVPKGDLKPKPYMATRYLQLQHANKQGKTSGDGRSVWNGRLIHQGRVWDVSSRGTGVTCLSPGAVEANRPLKTGETEFGYGCGLADIDELYGSALMSEILHGHDIGTERMLCIVDLGKGCGIGVRAAPNLLRPAHLFLFLKQGRREELARATDCLIERQTTNREWAFNPRAKDRYDCMLRETARDFARFVARLERNYVFAWLDWDGDNVLASAGIIDYGSIRQFGLRHDQYRYDDITRFSTNLNEQKDKARLTIQVYAQLVDFVKTGRKRPLSAFRDSSAVQLFDREFRRALRLIFLRQTGLSENAAEKVLAAHPRDVERFYSAFSSLERQKTLAGIKRVADGLNRPAVYDARALLRELPNWMLAASWAGGLSPVNTADALRAMQTGFCSKRDTRLTPSLQRRIRRLLESHALVMTRARDIESTGWKAFLQGAAAAAQDANREGRVTGNGGEYLVAELLLALKRGLPATEVQLALDLFVAQQSPRSRTAGKRAAPALLKHETAQLLQKLIDLAFEHQEDI